MNRYIRRLPIAGILTGCLAAGNAIAGSPNDAVTKASQNTRIHTTGIPHRGIWTDDSTFYNTLNDIFTCERQLKEKLNLLLKDNLQGIMASSPEDISAPQYFDIAGKSPQPVQLINQSRAQSSRQSVNIFGQYQVSPE